MEAILISECQLQYFLCVLSLSYKVCVLQSLTGFPIASLICTGRNIPLQAKQIN
ncbi:hypothetical protein PAHAL_4G122200 [Panicum hallii]|uniref:Uncharacterized protein n=1 Tax=Panicum hallii TaxID=206008 RepID=A0A2S3HIV7_9POAL|nr:hypothetical protein PAHAL_4G122200 [Panicum hallii]